ncbi:hypothetical protein BB558_004906 [Smittium angustum]|uniref:Smr domain-containing protein n=1 Tax=Smittium angustum TaxID=133377 RepID=A0A2U1J262_SMIAN|nr:hypothetical protein BB558_004906 [Smittium angustum]
MNNLPNNSKSKSSDEKPQNFKSAKDEKLIQERQELAYFLEAFYPDLDEETINNLLEDTIGISVNNYNDEIDDLGFEESNDNEDTLIDGSINQIEILDKLSTKFNIVRNNSQEFNTEEIACGNLEIPGLRRESLGNSNSDIEKDLDTSTSSQIKSGKLPTKSMFGDLEYKKPLKKMNKVSGSVQGVLSEVFGELDLEEAEKLSKQFDNPDEAVVYVLNKENEKEINDKTKRKGKTVWKQIEPKIIIKPSDSKNILSKQKTPIILLKSKSSQTATIKINNEYLRHALFVKPEGLMAIDAKNFILDSRIDPKICSEYKNVYMKKREYYFQKASSSFRRRNNVGMNSGISAFYAEEGKKCDMKAKMWWMRSAYAFVEQQRMIRKDPYLIDLHGLRLAESVYIVRLELFVWYGNETEKAPKPRVGCEIITGSGTHSDRGIQVLHPVVGRILGNEGWKFKELSERYFVYDRE